MWSLKLDNLVLIGALPNIWDYLLGGRQSDAFETTDELGICFRVTTTAGKISRPNKQILLINIGNNIILFWIDPTNIAKT